MDEDKNREQLEPSFLTIVMMLSGSAANYLVEALDEKKKAEKKKNLEMARCVIDLLGLLEEKTAGNLDESEKETLEVVLGEMRMQYIKVSG